MTLKDRFLDYWTTGEREYYTYDLSIFERLIYGTVGSIAITIVISGIILTLPIWSVPYMVYKSYRIKGDKNG